MQTLKKVSPNANTAPMAAPISLPAPHSVDMRKKCFNVSAHVRIHEQKTHQKNLNICVKKHVHAFNQKVRWTYKRDRSE
jgi:hypothetical protein